MQGVFFSGRSFSCSLFLSVLRFPGYKHGLNQIPSVILSAYACGKRDDPVVRGHFRRIIHAGVHGPLGKYRFQIGGKNVLIPEVVYFDQMSVVVIVGGKDAVTHHPVFQINVKGTVRIKKIPVLKAVQSGESAGCVPSVDHRIRVGEILPAEVLRIDTASVVRFLRFVVSQIKSFVFCRLQKGKADPGSRKVQPGIDIGIDLPEPVQIQISFLCQLGREADPRAIRRRCGAVFFLHAAAGGKE